MNGKFLVICVILAILSLTDCTKTQKGAGIGAVGGAAAGAGIGAAFGAPGSALQ